MYLEGIDNLNELTLLFFKNIPPKRTPCFAKVWMIWVKLSSGS